MYLAQTAGTLLHQSLLVDVSAVSHARVSFSDSQPTVSDDRTFYASMFAAFLPMISYGSTSPDRDACVLLGIGKFRLHEITLVLAKRLQLTLASQV